MIAAFEDICSVLGRSEGNMYSSKGTADKAKNIVSHNLLQRIGLRGTLQRSSSFYSFSYYNPHLSTVATIINLVCFLSVTFMFICPPDKWAAVAALLLLAKRKKQAYRPWYMYIFLITTRSEKIMLQPDKIRVSVILSNLNLICTK